MSNVIEELEEGLPDPDQGLKLKPEIKARLEKSLKLRDTAFISLDELRNQVTNH